MTVFPCSKGGFHSRQKAGQMAPGATWRHDVRPVFQESGSATIDHLPFGTVRTVDHFGSSGCFAEQTEMHADRRIRKEEREESDESIACFNQLNFGTVCYALLRTRDFLHIF